MKGNSQRKRLLRIYKILYKNFGPQHWWPADSPFEVIIGAILTQNTAWANVEKAIRNLKDKGLLSPKGLKSITKGRLASLIRPCGYFNIKAKRIKEFVEFLFYRYNGSLNLMHRNSLHALRKELLGVNGIGPETADSILLYALDRPIFVIDAYTKRILSRHGIIDEDAEYDQIQSLFMNSLPKSSRLFNEYHALFVRLGKEYCTKREPKCEECPLGDLWSANSFT